MVLKDKFPVDIVLSPEWWNVHEGIVFDRDFFFHPLKRVESEQKMEKALYERWGKYGLGANKDEKRPEVGAVHLAAGFMLSEMMGCEVRYSENHPPQVIECSHTMISTDDYENVLLEYDIKWSQQKRPFGIHYCGSDPHRFAASFARIPHLDFLDLGWGGDVKLLREYLPDTFFNLRLSPVEIKRQEETEIRDTIIRLVSESGNPYLTGICCINMDDTVGDKKIDTIFETIEELRKGYNHGGQI